MMKHKKWNIVIAVTVCICFTAVTFTGCGGKEITGQAMGAANLSSSVKDKYKEDEKFDYADPINDIKRDQSLYMDMEVDPLALGLKQYTEIVSVYQDPEMKKEIPSLYEHEEKDGIYKIKIQPPRDPMASIFQFNLKDTELGFDKTETYLFKEDDYTDWGNLRQMYMVQYRDEKTGDKLKKPIVTVVTIKSDLDAPKVKYSQTEKGQLRFTWEPVEGATKYFVVKSDLKKDRVTRDCTIIGQTKKSSWETEYDENFTNKDFKIYKISEDEWNDPSKVMKDYYKKEKKLTKKDIPLLQKDVYEYSVIAVNEKGTSARSNTFDGRELANKLPTQTTTYTENENPSGYLDSIGGAPAYRWIVLCDGTLAQKLINYDFSKAKEKKNQPFGSEDKNGKPKLTYQDIVVIPYAVEGTPFFGKITITSYDPKTLKKDLKDLEERQESLRNKPGNVDQDININEDTEAKEEEIDVKDFEVTANSALSEYLAINLIGSTENIDLSEFKESSDEEYLIDAVMEAMYQNPMALGVEDLFLSTDGKTLQIKYEDNKKTRDKKQEEIQDEVEKIVKEVIKDDMTDLEKEIALNEYLCSTTEYDTSALENAEKNDFKCVDPEFYDSFTSYGILVKKIGVCASYAASFKLLAEAAGLESIVVTGYLDGSLPHAWNKVKIDGKWQILDVTNNGNEFIKNPILNLSDAEINSALVEDDRFVLDANIKDYAANSTKAEYYRINKMYFNESKIAKKLAQQLKSKGKASLRTSINIDDEAFNKIAQETLSLAGIADAQGFYWLGVIYITE